MPLCPDWISYPLIWRIGKSAVLTNHYNGLEKLCPKCASTFLCLLNEWLLILKLCKNIASTLFILGFLVN